MEMKSSKQLYKKLFFIYTVILVCVVAALVGYFFTSTKRRFLEQRRNYTEMMNESAAVIWRNRRILRNISMKICTNPIWSLGTLCTI